MTWDKWVIDATMGYPFCFCPLEGETIITGMNVLADKPPGKGELVAVVHEDGQDAVEEFCAKYHDEIAAIREATRRSE